MRLTTTFMLVMAALGPRLLAHEFSGRIAAEGSVFFQDAQSSEQERDSVSVVLEPEYYHEWASGSSVVLVPFARVDSADPERSHVDIRELNVLLLADPFELRLGVGKVFWGATEFVHLVDIINQTDLVESIDGEEKLGQPMLQLSVPRRWGVVDAFVLPYFRERTYPGRRGRLRSEPAVDTDNPTYESSAEEYHTDFALRYSHTIGDMDFGVYHFVGTGREPTLVPTADGNGATVLVPFYEQINQTGFDLQWVLGRWLVKLESLYRTGQAESVFAVTGGFEYTFVGVLGSGADVGLIGEYAYDDRGDTATTPYQNDVMAALRVSLNDAAGSTLLAGLISDAETSASIAIVEASRRIGSRCKLSLETRMFSNLSRDDPAYSLRDDDFFQLELTYYF